MGRHKQPEPARFSAAELKEHIAIPENGDSGDEEVFDLNTLRERTLGELQRRLGDPEKAKDIPGTGLIQLAKEAIKLGERQDKPDDAEERSVLEQIDALPTPHAIKVLEAERERLTVELERVTLKLEELRHDPEALPVVP